MSNKVSNYPNAAKPNATPAEIGELVGVMDGLRKLPPVSKREPEKVQERLDYYFQYCTDNGIKCSVEGMTLALGVSRQCLWEWEQDTGSKSGELVRRAKELINSLLTQWTMDGKMNCVYSIWLQKNHFKYTDSTTAILEVRPETKIQSRTPEEIAASYGQKYLLNDDTSGFELPEPPEDDVSELPRLGGD